MIKDTMWIINPHAHNLGDMLGINIERQNILGSHLDRMVAELTPPRQLNMVYASEIIRRMEAFCDTKEEFLYCYSNHMAWHYRRGSVVPPKPDK